MAALLYKVGLAVLLLCLLNALGFWYALQFTPRGSDDTAPARSSFVRRYSAYLGAAASGDWGASRGVSTGTSIGRALGNSALPVLVFAVATVLLLGIERGLPPFVLGLTLTGGTNIAAFVQQRTRQLRAAAFIESARALGIGTPRLLCFHIAPHIWAAMPLLLCFELAAAILLLAELGYLGVFIGGGYVYSTPEEATRVTSGYPELGQLLSSFWATLYRAPWVSLFAGGLVALAITGCSLLGEGLRRRLDVTRPRRR